MICPKCGNTVPDTFAVCPQCACALTDSANAEAPAQAATAPQPAATPQPAAAPQPTYNQPQYAQQPVYQQPPYQQPTYQQPVYQQPPVYNQPPVYGQPIPAKPSSGWMVFNIILTILTGFSDILALIGAIFGIVAHSNYNGGNYQQAVSNSKVCKVLGIINLVCLLLGVVIAFIACIIVFASGGAYY